MVNRKYKGYELSIGEDGRDKFISSLQNVKTKKFVSNLDDFGEYNLGFLRKGDVVNFSKELINKNNKKFKYW